MNWNEYFTYDKATGELRWADGLVRYRTKVGGRVAGTKALRQDGGKKHVKIMLCGKRLVAHRIIWEMHNGPIPDKFVVDHINRDPWDNRIENLRLAGYGQNTWNSRNQSGSVVPIKGVSNITKLRYRPWYSTLKVNGVMVFSGRYRTKAEAAVAYAKASLRYHGKFSVYYKPTTATAKHRTT